MKVSPCKLPKKIVSLHGLCIMYKYMVKSYTVLPVANKAVIVEQYYTQLHLDYDVKDACIVQLYTAMN